MGATHSHERLDPAIPATPAPGEPGALVADRYRLVSRIHAGSAGALYRAEDLAFSRPVALRLLTPELSRDEAVLTRLQARLQASAAMARDDLGASGDIVELTDLGRSDGGLVFVVTDYIAGESLAAQLAREGPLPWRALRPLMVRACQIVHLSHQHGLLRLDLQTRHLFPIRDKTQTSTLKILSPGIGDVFGDSLWASLDPATAATHLRYAAPEQLTGGTIDARTDIYALGVIMYELLCGRVPFADARPAYVCARHLLEPPPPFPVGVRSKVPEAVIGIVARALAKAPEDRWPTMRALANAMAAIDFGPCDASGVLEVVDVERMEPPHPAASASMRIDPGSLHAPSPTVRPPTMPPTGLRADWLGPGAPAPGSSARSTPRPGSWYSLPEEGAAAGSSSRMAWDEILAAAEEAVAAVAAAAGSVTGTAGDSDVFMPERLLRTGEATKAPKPRDTQPDVRAVPGEFGSPAPEASDSAGILPAVLILGHPAPWHPGPLLRGEAGAEVERAVDDLDADRPAANDRSGDSPAGRAAALESAMRAEDSSLRAAVDRSGTLWPVAATFQIEARPARSRRYAWAAAVILTLGVTAAALRGLRSEPPATDAAASQVSAVTTPQAPYPTGPVPASSARGLAPSQVAAAPKLLSRPGAGPHDLSPGPASGARVGLPQGTGPRDLSSGTGSGAPRGLGADLSPRPGAAHVEPSPGPTDADPWNQASGDTDAAARAGAGSDLAPETGVKPAARPGAAPAKTSAPGTPSAEASPEPRKPLPGTHMPDAGHELAAPIDHDPLHAAELLERAEQAAGRGEQALALSLATQSYHAQPNANALRLAGEQACKLGDAGKARWARQHLAPGERGPVDAACQAAGVELD